MDINEEYKRWHWGVEPAFELELPTPPYPDKLVEIGRLCEIHLKKNQKKGRATKALKRNPNLFYKEIFENPILEVERSYWNDGFVFYDPEHENQRIYYWTDGQLKKELKEFYSVMNNNPRKLSELAEIAGGSHSDDDYPNLSAKPLGFVKNLAYFTYKLGDDPPLPYIHEMGEEGGLYPIVALDQYGRLWYCGGSYTCPYAGITN